MYKLCYYVPASHLEATKQALFATTEAAIEAGVFGAPSFMVHTSAGPQLFWGADRLDLALQAAMTKEPQAAPA